MARPQFAQLRPRHPAGRDRDRATRMEDAARRRVDRARHFAATGWKARSASTAGSGTGTAASNALV